MLFLALMEPPPQHSTLSHGLPWNLFPWASASALPSIALLTLRWCQQKHKI